MAHTCDPSICREWGRGKKAEESELQSHSCMRLKCEANLEHTRVPVSETEGKKSGEPACG